MKAFYTPVPFLVGIAGMIGGAFALAYHHPATLGWWIFGIGAALVFISWGFDL